MNTKKCHYKEQVDYLLEIINKQMPNDLIVINSCFEQCVGN